MKYLFVALIIILNQVKIEAKNSILPEQSNVVLNVRLLIENGRQFGYDVDILVKKLNSGHDTLIEVEKRHVVNLYLDYSTSYSVRFVKDGFVNKEIFVHTPAPRWVPEPIQYDVQINLFVLPIQLEGYYFQMANLKFNKRLGSFDYNKKDAETIQNQLSQYLVRLKD